MATLYIEVEPLLHMPGTASYEWREDFARALANGRDWLDLNVVLIGKHELDPIVHAAIHEWEVDRVLFGGHTRTGFLNAAGLDFGKHPVDQVWLLSTTLYPRPDRAHQDKLDKFRLHTRVRTLPVRDDVIQPIIGDDLVEVFAAFVRERET